MNNVFKLGFHPSYYFKHPIEFVKEIAANLKAAWMRATKGYCYTDVWNFDDWFCTIVPPMLRHMAEHGMAYPGGEPFETPEKWHKWLHNMANTIERLGYDNWLEDNNEYSQLYERTFEDDTKSEEKEKIRKQYYERCKEIHPTRAKVLEDFGRSFFKYFDSLWD